MSTECRSYSSYLCEYLVAYEFPSILIWRCPKIKNKTKNYYLFTERLLPRNTLVGDEDGCSAGSNLVWEMAWVQILHWHKNFSCTSSWGLNLRLSKCLMQKFQVLVGCVKFGLIKLLLNFLDKLIFHKAAQILQILLLLSFRFGLTNNAETVNLYDNVVSWMLVWKGYQIWGAPKII